ncbi:MAG: tyrosine-type recombinase/integrase [Candidatus Marinimicrobia bacterium]|jgi:site-specific recombinase XerD|nr:tyrosine-type recombinase/integrase [Candidatus Neomarinimicrobiota bacterium]MBT4946706.1 tyrosine-type recombinase/integrase [Candidatus Neomarinimicrobiota bacterium]
MASIRKMRGKWYSRVRWYDNTIGKQKEYLQPLRTDNKTVAHKRNQIVTKYQDDIGSGMEFEFPWMTDGGETKIKEMTLGEAVDSWIERRIKQPDIRPSTIEINKNGMSHLYNTVPNTYPLKSITTEHMDAFRDDLVDKGLSIATINMHLRTAKSFFRYVWKRGTIDRLPMIEMVDTNDTLPIYLTDDDFHEVLNEVGVDSFYGKVFFFYRETGVRLREPFISSLDGNWLDIPNLSKGKRPRSIELSDFLVEVYKELCEWADTCGLSKGSRGRHLSKKFKKVLRKCGVNESKHLHSLRHTYAVRQRVMGIPLATIQAHMGHRSITTTEIYAKLELKKLRRHFPTLISQYTEEQIEAEKVLKTPIRDTDLRDTDQYKQLFIEKKSIN